MVSIGTPKSSTATKIILLGAGELGKEVAIEAQRYGIHIMAIDKYPDAPAMHVAHESMVVDMLNHDELERVIRKFNPDFIVPEIEAISTQTLIQLEKDGFHVIPNANAVNLTMNRENIRNFVSKDLNIKTSNYKFAESIDEFRKAILEIGFPCVSKPIMSSSGKGQTLIQDASMIESAWIYGQTGGRSGKGKMIIEEFVPFDYEITLLTIRHVGGTSFLPPIGHMQIKGDYVESWQPHPMQESVLEECQKIAEKVTGGLGGNGLFGVELFIKGEEVFFSEVSPRPHDTGMVTLISSNHSEFALHVRAILGLPMPNLRTYGYAASSAILFEGEYKEPVFENLNKALTEPDTSIRLFGKPEIRGKRRMGVALALGDSLEEARRKAKKVSDSISIKR
ncbi:MAG: formate-dependent phosphoribosylglycinamide formyltransferase [Leptospiraceae bacterium]|nr:formate-dependent phosphoribosylglycinamide formyltransferase [Leptospiraceae bacterium]MCP5512259.1 formate-dependent phosphoribosylglycinamide formyltransferase [Leptospiraceae bacterium]